LPFPELLRLTPASRHDLVAVKEDLKRLHGRQVYADKAYANQPFHQQLATRKQTIIMTPIKLKVGQSEWERAFNKAADQLFSRAVSAIRQPIESLFAWLIEKTDIQRASKVRSTKGLMVHIFGRFAAAWATKVPALNP
ncbi:MAG: transposase, partial [Bacteroidota bacterium]